MNKPPHLLVHPSKPGNPSTLLDGLEEMFAYERVTSDHKLSVINRLDRETSGIVLVARHKTAARMLGKAQEAREFSKAYHAIVRGWPETDSFEVGAPILRKGEVEPSEVWVRQRVHPDGKPCLTRFEVVKRFEKETTNGNRFSLVKCDLLTGRMHQIRVHLAHVGHPIVGDKIYGPDEKCYLNFIDTGWTDDLEKLLLLNRQALHASGFGWRDQEWKCELPKDMKSFLGF